GARRADCRRSAEDCALLGHELERAIWVAEHSPTPGEPVTAATRLSWMREARDAYLRACDAGNARGCSAEGMAAELDHDRDAAHVALMYQKGCEGGVGTACAYLAGIYERGLGSTRAGIRHLDFAGSPDVDVPAGMSDPNGSTVEKNPELAAQYYERACQLGDTNSCGIAGRILVE